MTRILCPAISSVLFVCTLAIAADPVGWRTYNGGHYPDADPPTTWSADTNVVWKCALPSWSNASPAVLPDRIFVCSEPTDLVCVNKADSEASCSGVSSGTSGAVRVRFLMHLMRSRPAAGQTQPPKNNTE